MCLLGALLLVAVAPGATGVLELPQLSLSQTDQVLVLVFQVTGGVNLTSLRVGPTLVGTMSVEVPPAF